MAEETSEIVLAEGIQETGGAVDVPRGSYRLKLSGGPLNGALVIPQVFDDDAWTSIYQGDVAISADALPRTYPCSFGNACKVRIAIGGRPAGVSAVLERK